MARVKKDKTGWRASGIYKKDFSPRLEETKHHSRKNTKKWCRGKVGMKHILERVTKWVIGKTTCRTDKCKVCGKEFLYFYENTNNI